MSSSASSRQSPRRMSIYLSLAPAGPHSHTQTHRHGPLSTANSVVGPHVLSLRPYADHGVEEQIVSEPNSETYVRIKIVNALAINLFTSIDPS
ncbi:hypothetical protein E2C01_059698 [Portunus trituberculatus]|uniref:Uncharacterized protein n=1 Tax=Portunus trituberculatus TaxID=210409 RepID=A0A5B7H016_PORTR|nr:hypothetical protein [Portunus trituberculatus]